MKGARGEEGKEEGNLLGKNGIKRMGERMERSEGGKERVEGSEEGKERMVGGRRGRKEGKERIEGREGGKG